jgi:hypothetical protein
VSNQLTQLQDAAIVNFRIICELFSAICELVIIDIGMCALY